MPLTSVSYLFAKIVLPKIVSYLLYSFHVLASNRNCSSIVIYVLIVYIPIYSISAASRFDLSRLAVGQWQRNSRPSLRVWIEAKPHKAAVHHLDSDLCSSGALVFISDAVISQWYLTVTLDSFRGLL